MLTIGKEYRVWSRLDGASAREGVVVEVDGPMFAMTVEGVRTIYHMAAVAFVELVDREAEEARQAKRHAAQIAAWS